MTYIMPTKSGWYLAPSRMRDDIVVGRRPRYYTLAHQGHGEEEKRSLAQKEMATI